MQSFASFRAQGEIYGTVYEKLQRKISRYARNDTLTGVSPAGSDLWDNSEIN